MALHLHTKLSVIQLKSTRCATMLILFSSSTPLHILSKYTLTSTSESIFLKKLMCWKQEKGQVQEFERFSQRPNWDGWTTGSEHLQTCSSPQEEQW